MKDKKKKIDKEMKKSNKKKVEKREIGIETVKEEMVTEKIDEKREIELRE